MSEVMANVTTGLDSMPTFSSWFSGLIIVGIATIILAILIVSISSLERYRRLWKFIQHIGDSFKYFFWGVGGLTILAVPSLFLYWEISNASRGNVLPIKWTLIPIGIYLAVAMIGYIFKKYVVDRIKKFHKKMNNHNYKEVTNR